MNQEVLQTIYDRLMNAEALLRGVHKAELQKESDDQLPAPSSSRVGQVLVETSRARRNFEYWFMPTAGWQGDDEFNHEDLPF